MQKITLSKAWDYVTPAKTIAYPAGEHEVINEIAEAAAQAGVIGEPNNGDGDKPATTGKKGASTNSKG